jgi:hypothetical protein
MQKMTLDEFRQSLAASEPPAGLSLAIVGLWWDAKGDWNRAHQSAQQDEGVEGSWVHAYLHRQSNRGTDLDSQVRRHDLGVLGTLTTKVLSENNSDFQAHPPLPDSSLPRGANNFFPSFALEQ